MKNEIIRAESITKVILGKKVLRRARINLFTGELLGVIGLDCSGVAELMKIISGFYPPDDGVIYINGHKETITRDNANQQFGIFYIGQDTMLIPGMTILENISIVVANAGLIFNQKKLYEQTLTQLKIVGLEIDPNWKADDLLPEQELLVHICRALVTGAQVIIINGVTGSYDRIALHHLKAVLKKLKNKGISIIYANNRLDTIYKDADRITILENGRHVWTLNRDEYTENKALSFLSAFEFTGNKKASPNGLGEEVFRVESLTCNGFYENVSFSLQKGEILGLAMYNDKTKDALGKGLFGMRKAVQGKIFVEGKKLKLNSPDLAIKAGIGFIPENVHEGIFTNFTVRENIALLLPKKPKNRSVIINPGVERYIGKLVLDGVGLSGRLEELVVGFNALEKVKLAVQKWMVLKPKVLIFVNPSLGVDPAGQIEIHSMLGDIAKQKVGILLITSDLHGLFEISDRIILGGVPNSVEFQMGSIAPNSPRYHQLCRVHFWPFNLIVKHCN